MTINLYTMAQPPTAARDNWLISTWDAGQTSLNDWEASNVTQAADGTVTLTLDRAPSGTGDQPFDGAEIQQTDIAASSGSWSYVAKAPVMADGGIFGMFLYQADWQDDWIEYDFEFVGKDTTKVQLTVHMEDPNGNHISASKVVALGFDAAKVFATYTINVDSDSAEFYANGVRLAQFTASDMADGQWDTGPLHSYVDLWATDNVGWAGAWTGGSTLVAQIKDASYLASTAPPPVSTPPTQGTASNDVWTGTAGDDSFFGLAGNDTLDGVAGQDNLQGGSGADVLRGGNGSDLLIGGSGRDDMDGGADTLRDVFVFQSAGDSTGGSRDIVRQFMSGVDKIDLSTIDVRSNLSGDQGFVYSGRNAQAYSVWTVKSGTDLMVRADVTGDSIADFHFQLSKVSALIADDFIL